MRRIVLVLICLICSQNTGSTQRRLPVSDSARVRPPVRVSVDAARFAGHPRNCSVLARGLKLRVPGSAPPVWLRTPSSRLMSSAISDFVAAGVLRRGEPSNCYRLFPVPKSTDTARLVYDLSSLTPFMPRRPCYLPNVTYQYKLLSAKSSDTTFCTK